MAGVLIPVTTISKSKGGFLFRGAKKAKSTKEIKGLGPVFPSTRDSDRAKNAVAMDVHRRLQSGEGVSKAVLPALGRVARSRKTAYAAGVGTGYGFDVVSGGHARRKAFRQVNRENPSLAQRYGQVEDTGTFKPGTQRYDEKTERRLDSADRAHRKAVGRQMQRNEVSKRLVDVGNAKTAGREVMRGANKRRGRIGLLTGGAAEMNRERLSGKSVSKRTLGPTYRGTHGRYVSHASDLMVVDNARKSPIDGRLQVTKTRNDRSGGLAPIGTRRTRSRAANGKIPNGNSRGHRLI